MNSDALVGILPPQIYTVYVVAAVAIVATFVCSIARVSAVVMTLAQSLLVFLVHLIPAGRGHYPPDLYGAGVQIARGDGANGGEGLETLPKAVEMHQAANTSLWHRGWPSRL
jgi:hypothetical protein